MKIISNTTIQRPEAIRGNPVAEETGGLSGRPLFSLSTDILKDMYILTKVLSFKKLPICLLKRSYSYVLFDIVPINFVHLIDATRLILL